MSTCAHRVTDCDPSCDACESVDWQSRATAAVARDESQDLYLDTFMICSGSTLIERYPVSDKPGFGGVDVSRYVLASELDAAQSRAIVAEKRIVELSAKLELAREAVSADIFEQRKRADELKPLADLARKIGEAHAQYLAPGDDVSALLALDDRDMLLDQAAALVGKDGV